MLNWPFALKCNFTVSFFGDIRTMARGRKQGLSQSLRQRSNMTARANVAFHHSQKGVKRRVFMFRFNAGHDDFAVMRIEPHLPAAVTAEHLPDRLGHDCTTINATPPTD